MIQTNPLPHRRMRSSLTFDPFASKNIIEIILVMWLYMVRKSLELEQSHWLTRIIRTISLADENY